MGISIFIMITLKSSPFWRISVDWVLFHHGQGEVPMRQVWDVVPQQSLFLPVSKNSSSFSEDSKNWVLTWGNGAGVLGYISTVELQDMLEGQLSERNFNMCEALGSSSTTIYTTTTRVYMHMTHTQVHRTHGTHACPCTHIHTHAYSGSYAHTHIYTYTLTQSSVTPLLKDQIDLCSLCQHQTHIYYANIFRQNTHTHKY